MSFNIQKNHVKESLILLGGSTFCNVRIDYRNCVIVKVKYLKYFGLHIN